MVLLEIRVEFRDQELDAIYELKRQMMFLERAHAYARMGHFVLDPKRQTIEFSSWVRGNIGLNDIPIPLDRLPELVPEKERAGLAARVASIIEAEDDFAFETNVVTAKGAVRTQRVSGIPAFENQAKREGLIGFYGILQEITSEKEAQQSLVEARDKAQAELEARTNILATVSHEIRTPLGGILGIIDQLKRERSATERERALELMEDSCQALLDTLDAILQQARLSQDIRQGKARRFRPSAVAQRVAELFRPLARRKAIRIEVDAVSDAQAIGDPGRIQQVLANFVSNAVKFTQAGVVTIDVEPPIAGERDWTFIVSDTGSGMDQNRIDTIFDPFDTSGRDSLGRSVGAGLGLSITRDLVGAMGGQIEVESEVGRGSSFTILLPLEEAEDTPAEILKGKARGLIFIAIEKATKQIQAEAVATQSGWTVLSDLSEVSEGDNGHMPLVILTDVLSTQRVPQELLETASRIVVLADTEERPTLSDEVASVFVTVQASNIVRQLPEVLNKIANEHA